MIVGVVVVVPRLRFGAPLRHHLLQVCMLLLQVLLMWFVFVINLVDSAAYRLPQKFMVIQTAMVVGY